MADGTLPFPAARSAAFEGRIVMIALAGERYGLPVAAVEAIAPPPALCRVPHAPPALLGAGHLGGQVLPIVDLAALLPGSRTSRRYNGGGEVLRVRAGGGSVGIWVDRVERLFDVGKAAETITVIDPEPLIAGLAPRVLAPDARHPLGDADEVAEPQAIAAIEASYIAVDASGQTILLPQQAVLELIEPPPHVALPGAPGGFCGVGILRGDALPMLSLSALLALPVSASAGCFALMALRDQRLLLGFDRIIGLQVQGGGIGGRHGSRVFDLTAAVPAELQNIVAAFAAPTAAARGLGVANGSGTRQYLAFIVGRQSYALPVEAVDRVVPPQPLVGLPQVPGGSGRIAGAIDLRGQVIPVATIAASPGEVGAYVIMRDAGGPIAIGVERVDRLVSLDPEQISPVRNADELIDGVGLLGEGRDLLRILSPDRIGGG